MSHRRRVFFVSDRTGLTVEALGTSLITQFDGIDFVRVTVPFVDSADKAREVVAQVNAAYRESGKRPLVFSSLVNDAVREEINKVDGLVLDVFGKFIVPLEQELGQKSMHAVGKSHSAGNAKDYNHRIEAINYTLSHDDGVTHRGLEEADLILVGVSRSGKTPTCLYMAMHFHLKCANYPLNDDDLEYARLPQPLLAARNRLYALTINPEQLSRIRNGRRPASRYASLAQCRSEVERAELLFREEGIPVIDATAVSIEEIATTIQQHFRFQRPHH